LSFDEAKIAGCRSLVSFVMTAFLLSACSSGGGSSDPTPSVGLSVTPGSSTVVAGQSGVQLSATLVLSSGAVDDTATFTWASDDSSIVSVDANGFATGLRVGMARISATSGTSTGSASVWVMSPNPGAQNLTLMGTARYEDREYDLNGFTGEIRSKAIRNTVIEVVAIDGFQVIGTGATDASGKFNLTADNSKNQGGVYLRVISRTDPSHTEKIEVRNNSTEAAFFAFASPALDDSASEAFSATQDLLVTTDEIGGAFNIIDVMSDASALVQATGLSCPEPYPTCVPPLAKVYWEPGSLEGTFYDSGADAISVLGGGFGGDTDEYDDVILAHEYAHFILSKFSRDDSPGGQHDLFDNTQDIRLSWSEGWASFFAFAVLKSPLYIDTVQGGTLISLNNEDYSGAFKSGPPLSALAIYTTSEVAVSGVLWDVIDGINGGEAEELDLSFKEVFQTILDFPTNKPTSLETFWTTFESATSTESFADDLQNILRERKISLFADSGEAAESELVVNGARQTHTLYQNGADPAGDLDAIPFSAISGTTYILRTFNLNSGADTFLSILGPSSEPIATNDNASGLTYPSCGVNPLTGLSTCPANNTSNLASTLTFTAQQTGPFTAEVRRSEAAPPSAGLLGAYEIELTSP